MPSIVNLHDDLRQGNEYQSGIRARAGFNHEHWEIHQGKSYVVSSQSVGDILGDGEYVDLGFKTPDDGEVHLVFQFNAKLAAHLNFYTDCNWSGGSGTAIPIINRNQILNTQTAVLSNINQTGFLASGTAISGIVGMNGTLAYSRYAFAEKFSEGQGGRGRQEIILNTGTQYAVRLYSDAASNSVQLELDWYEED